MNGTAIIITLEALALVIWVVLALGYDQKIKRWEDRTARRIKRWKDRMIRRIKRRLCERWLNRGDLEARRVRSSEFGVRR